MGIRYSYDQWILMGKWAQLADGKVFYVSKGKGDPIVFLHLFGGNSWWFSRVIDELAEIYSVYAIDLPGCAQSDTPPLPYGPPQFADALHQFLNSLGIEKVNLIGHRGGALTSAHFATTRPTRVRKLVLDATPAWNRLDGRRYWRERMGAKWLDENGLLKPFEEWGGGVERFPGLNKADRDIAIQRMSQDFSQHSRWFLTILKEALSYDVYARLHKVQAPTLLVYAEREWGRSSAERLLNSIVGSRSVVIPKAGTIPAFERPNEYVEAILDFLDEPQ